MEDGERVRGFRFGHAARASGYGGEIEKGNESDLVTRLRVPIRFDSRRY